MGLLVLSNTVVRSLLMDLTKDDLTRMKEALERALLDYSLGGKETCGAARYQPPRSVIRRPTERVSFFLPAVSDTVASIKLLGSSPVGASARKDATSAATSSTQPTAPRGAVLMLDPEGNGIAVVGAEELTGFRTSLAALLLFNRRQNVSNIVVFGAGKQAEWHIRLALLLRGAEVRTITIVNRSRKRAKALLDQLSQMTASSCGSNVGFHLLDTSSESYELDLQLLLREAHAVFCTTASTRPLFSAQSIIRNYNSVCKGPYIAAIGSYQPIMLELPPGLVRHAAESHGSNNDAGIVVDSKKAALHEAGDIIQAHVKEEQLIEIGEILGYLASSLSKGESENGHFGRWLGEGLVIYKGIGCGVMDIAVAQVLVSIARERGLGAFVEDF